MSKVIYEADVMRKMVRNDRYLAFVYNDLLNRGHEESYVLKYLFNSNVIGDSLMESSYLEQRDEQ